MNFELIKSWVIATVIYAVSVLLGITAYNLWFRDPGVAGVSYEASVKPIAEEATPAGEVTIECLIENAVYQLAVPSEPNVTTAELTFHPMTIATASTDLFAKLAISFFDEDGTAYDVALSGWLSASNGYPNDEVTFYKESEEIWTDDNNEPLIPSNPIKEDIDSKILFFEYYDNILDISRKNWPMPRSRNKAPAAILMPGLGSKLYYNDFVDKVPRVYVRTGFFYLNACLSN